MRGPWPSMPHRIPDSESRIWCRPPPRAEVQQLGISRVVVQCALEHTLGEEPLAILGQEPREPDGRVCECRILVQGVLPRDARGIAHARGERRLTSHQVLYRAIVSGRTVTTPDGGRRSGRQQRRVRSTPGARDGSGLRLRRRTGRRSRQKHEAKRDPETHRGNLQPGAPMRPPPPPLRPRPPARRPTCVAHPPAPAPAPYSP